MDYKKVYLAAFEKTFDEIDSHIISKVKTYRKRDKNFTAIVNQIEKDLKERENEIRTSLNHNFPDLYDLYKNRFNEYGSDHLTSYFKYDFQDSVEKFAESRLEECAAELGALESYSRASVNFSNSDKFLEAIYALNKNYEHYTLTFEPNENPVDSNLFHEMQKERFPGYGQEPNLVEAALEEINSDPAEEMVLKFTKVLQDFSPQKPTEPEEAPKGEVHLKPGDILNDDEKLFILHLLRNFTDKGSDLNTTEFLRVLHLTFSVIESVPDLSGNLPHYRKVNDGWINFKKNERILRLENLIAKLNRYQLPTIKSTLTQKLKTELRKK